MSFEGHYQALCKNAHYHAFPLHVVEERLETLSCGWCNTPIVWINLVNDTNCESEGRIDLKPSGKVDEFTRTFKIERYTLPSVGEGTWLKEIPLKALVIRLNREVHPNAARMFIQKVGEHQVCGSIDAWDGTELAVHIPPQAVVDTEREEFSWLKDSKLFNPAKEGDVRFHRIQAVERRGILSYGLMAEAPLGSVEGDDVTALLGVTFDGL